MKVIVDRDEFLQLELPLEKEYLITNCIGGYASSTVLDCHTRKYHGLLVVPISNGKRFNLLSKLDISLNTNGKDISLSTNRFPGVYFPKGYQYIDNFEMELYPITKFRIENIEITKSIIMSQNVNTVLLRLDLLKADSKVILKVRPFLAYRDIHNIVKENMYIRQRTFFEENGFKIDPYMGMPPLYIQTSSKSTFYPSPDWWRNFEYQEERNRGYEYEEDLFSPGIFEVKLEKGDSVIFRASVEKKSMSIMDEWGLELKQIISDFNNYSKEGEPYDTLKNASTYYIVDNRGITAGYHWFNEWGRDTMISLTGLTLCTGKKDIAFDILLKYAKYLKSGLLPNFLSDDDNHSYNSIDTSLLFFWAIQNYICYTKERDRIKEHIIGSMVDIIDAFIEDRVPFAEIKKDGFLYVGNKDTQLTWMDAVADGKPVTPRFGAAVEINALWYNAMSFLIHEFRGSLEKRLREEIEDRIKLFEKNFLNAFWNEETKSLNDVYRSDHDIDISIRPNQLFALALPYPCVDETKALLIIETVKKHLVTPYGLRTLSPEDPLYKSDYSGDQKKRDEAYHQGMVWPWLIGIYCDALFSYIEDKKKIKEYVYNTFKDLWNTHLYRYGLLHISEIFNPDQPYTANGCIAQAWSMGEVIRTLDRIKDV